MATTATRTDNNPITNQSSDPIRNDEVGPSESNSLIIGEVHTRFNRQSDFVPLLSLEDKEISVIGVGAIGRAIALQLAAIGVRKLTLFDFDTVTPTNVTTQGFLASDVGKEKVHAMEEAIHAIDPSIEVMAICDKFRPSNKLTGIVFVAVDSIGARTAIFNQLKGKVELLIDCRMLGEIWRVLTVYDEESAKHYEGTLFKPEEQAQGRCTGHATIYSANMPASWAVHMLTRNLRGFMMEQDMECNMLAGELLPITVL